MKKIFTLFAALVCMIGLQATTVTVAPNGNVCDVTVDGTTYNNLSVTTQGDIHLVAINRDGVSLLVRYTDTNTVSAIGTINGQPVNYASDAVAAYAKGFQIPNSDFEEWHSVGNDLEEPGAEGSLYSWHGFGTCFGTFSGFARTGSTLIQSTNNHNNSRCAVIETQSVMGATANGTMTTGRLKAGGMSATSTNNHSEMFVPGSDNTSTYNDNYASYGPFYVLLKAKPDAIKSWLKVVLHNTDEHRANLSAAITNGKYYQEPKDKEYTDIVAATAGSTDIIPNGNWQEYTYPFTYYENVEAKAIMVTISTNAKPGKGTVGDQVYIDDVELVYNAAITNIALNGATLEGFNFNAATKSYDLTYSGAAMNLTADNFVVTTEGVSAMVVKNVEDLGCGNYRIAIGVTSPDFKNGEVYTINVTKRPIYILGDVNGKDWAANDGVEMDTEDGTIYTATVTTSRDNGNYFGFTSMLANDNDDGAWNYILPYRFGAELNGDGDFWITDALLNTALNLGADGTTRAFRLEKGEWDLKVDMSARTLTVTKVQQVIPGDVDGSGTVDVSDVNLVVNIILGKAQFANYPNADVDGNGTVDVTDVNAVVNIILGK